VGTRRLSLPTCIMLSFGRLVGIGKTTGKTCLPLSSVPRRPGGLPRAPDGTGRLTVVGPGRPKGRTAVFGQDGGPYRVRHISAGRGDGQRRTAGDSTSYVS